MKRQIEIHPAARADRAQENPRRSGTHEVAPDLAYKRLAIVNIVFYGLAGAKDREWVLIDSGVPGTAGLIARAAANRFGRDSRPAAIILTHGHFDHVGAVVSLAGKWEVPVYAHLLEVPYLNGTSSYPPADSTAGGGLMAALSPMYPRGPVNVGHWLRPLGAEEVPHMPGWRWIHTPGHAPGHITLWRETDRAMIVGDAFITTHQESAYSVAVQRPEMHGPPTYYTPDWEAAERSVQGLAALDPELAITGHGPAMRGAEMRQALHRLAADFKQIAVPEHGHYVHAV
jgi:glyoxylase-like metal-dependent hydrolase (beta-lactamase superfamily II)